MHPVEFSFLFNSPISWHLPPHLPQPRLHHSSSGDGASPWTRSASSRRPRSSWKFGSKSLSHGSQAVDCALFRGDVVFCVMLSHVCSWMMVFYRPKIEVLLQIVKCHIVSECSSESMDAYLLRWNSNNSHYRSCVWQFLLPSNFLSFSLIIIVRAACLFLPIAASSRHVVLPHYSLLLNHLLN